MQYMQTGRAAEAVRAALAARAIQQRTGLADEGVGGVAAILLRACTWQEDFAAVEREAAMALAAPEWPAPVKLVLVPGAQALARLEAGHLAQAAEAAKAAEEQARRLGFGQHFFAVDYLRALSGLALERRDLDTAEQLTEQALSIAERGRSSWEFLALLERAGIWAARGQVRDALATVETARQVLAGTGSELLARADELEALLRLSLGDLRPAAKLARGLPAARRTLLQAKIVLAAGDHHAVRQQLGAMLPGELTPRRALERQVLLAAAAIESGDPSAAAILGDALHTARHGGFLNTVITTAPQVASYLIEHSAQDQPDPFLEQLVAAALQVRAIQPDASPSGRALIEALTPTQLRILKLLPTSTIPQIAAALYMSRNTVKTHLKAIYQKLGAGTRSEAIQRAIVQQLL
jgi:LuxR family transcriptional regulator, maltose regulon positive regulatory protein